MNELSVSALQFDLAWENKTANLLEVERMLSQMPSQTDVAVLPEMFSTGFSLNNSHLAEPVDGETVQTLKRLAQTYNIALVGSFICAEGGQIFNRGFFITSETEHFYDKRHLFRLGGESTLFTPGNNRTIIEYRGLRIALATCYDLRFPVWLRRTTNFNYDVLLCVANWPSARTHVWEILLRARAIENQAFVCGVNRIGADASGLPHEGASQAIDFKGEPLFRLGNEKSIGTATFRKSQLDAFRQKFPVWLDADAFSLEI